MRQASAPRENQDRMPTRTTGMVKEMLWVPFGLGGIEQVLCDERNSELAEGLMMLIILVRELGVLWKKLNEN
jgi:hypothetical protein